MATISANNVPDVAPGPYQVCSVFAGYATPCSTYTVVAGGDAPVDVEGVAVERGTPSGGGSGPGALARTGLGIGLLVAVAVALLVLGRSLQSTSRDRGRRRAAR
jgi:hypothetical protein